MSDKKYPASVTPLYKSGFAFNSIKISAQILETLSTVELGGKLSVRMLKQPTDSGIVGWLDYLTPSEVEERAEAFRTKGKQVQDSI